MNKVDRVQDFLGHILTAIERIERHTFGLDAAGFLDSELVQDAVLRNIEVIGEASGNILRGSPEFAALHADIPWQVMYTMRNRVSHGYDTVDLDIVWKTIQADLPSLKVRNQSVRALGRQGDSPGSAEAG